MTRDSDDIWLKQDWHYSGFDSNEISPSVWSYTDNPEHHVLLDKDGNNLIKQRTRKIGFI